MKIQVLVNAESIVKSNPDLKLRDIIPDKIIDGSSTGFVKIVDAREPLWMFRGEEKFSTPFNQACVYKMRLREIEKMKHPSLAKEKSKLEDQLNVLLDSSALTAFSTITYIKITNREVAVGFKGSKLLLLADPKSVSNISVLGNYDPFNLLGVRGLDIENPSFPVLNYDRYIIDDISEEAIKYVQTNPINMLHLAAYIEEMALCYTKVDTLTVVQSGYNLMGRLKKFINKIEDYQELVEYVPRSLEELARAFGYNATLPLIDADWGHVEMSKDIKANISCLDRIMLSYLEKSGIISHFTYIPRSIFMAHTFNIDALTLYQMRDIYRFLVELYTKKSFSPTSRINIDLGYLLNEAWAQ